MVSQIGCQLNAWQRELDLRTPAWEKLDAALAQLAQAGYAGVEVPGWSVPDLGQPAKLRDLCARHAVRLVALHAGGPFFDDAAYYEQTLLRVLPVAQCAAGAGAVGLVVSNTSMKGRLASFGTPEGRASEAWRTQVRNVSDLARRLRDLGLRAYFHNHHQQFEHDGWEMESVLAADPEMVELCIDVGHAAQAMAQPALLDWLAAHWERIGVLHYKDIDREGQIVEALGDGEVDFGAISRLARERGFSGWIVAELEMGRGRPPARTVLEDARRSYALIARALGAEGGEIDQQRRT